MNVIPRQRKKVLKKKSLYALVVYARWTKSKWMKSLPLSGKYSIADILSYQLSEG